MIGMELSEEVFENAGTSDPLCGVYHHVGGRRPALEWLRAAVDCLYATRQRTLMFSGHEFGRQVNITFSRIGRFFGR